MSREELIVLTCGAMVIGVTAALTIDDTITGFVVALLGGGAWGIVVPRFFRR